MSSFDAYTLQLLEQAKRFYEKANENDLDESKIAYLHASLLLAICYIEAVVNNIVNEFEKTKLFDINEKAVLQEKDIVLVKGSFQLSHFKMTRFFDKLDILFIKFTKNVPNSCTWWSHLKQGIDIRNNIVHPKNEVKVTSKVVENTLRAVIECTDILYKAIYKKPFPYYKMGLNSKLIF